MGRPKKKGQLLATLRGETDRQRKTWLPRRLTTAERVELIELFFVPAEITSELEAGFVLGRVQGLTPKEAMAYAGYAETSVNNKWRDKEHLFAPLIRKCVEHMTEADESYTPKKLEEILKKLDNAMDREEDSGKLRQLAETYERFKAAYEKAKAEAVEEKPLSEKDIEELLGDVKKLEISLDDHNVEAYLDAVARGSVEK